MKTLTEFPAMNLKNAAKVKQELTASGKTPEELPQAFGESLKIEGDRLTYLLNALEIIGNRMEDLKRTVVYSLGENEKAPQGAVQKGDQYYLVEYYPALEKKGSKKEFKGAHPAGDQKKGNRGKKGGGGRGRNDRTERSPAGPKSKPSSDFPKISTGKV